MRETRKLDADEIPLPAIAQKDGKAMTFRCRTPGEAYLVCDELEKDDIITILPDEEELLAQFRRNGYVDVQVSAKAYESLAHLRSTVEFQHQRLRSEQPLPPSARVLALFVAMMIVPGILVFAYMLTGYQKNGYLRMARDWKFWFSVGFAAWLLMVILIASLSS